MNLKALVYAICFFCLMTGGLYSQEEEMSIAPATVAGENLDLQAVMEMFKESESVEDFEKSLNTPESEINNLDLNEDGEIDYIRVVELAEGDSHLFALQVQLAENEFQDVATIQIEKSGDDTIIQAAGDPEIYGNNYIIEPASSSVMYVRTWPIVSAIYSPGYRLWLSPWRWRTYPRWWRPWRPVTRSIYRVRTSRWTTRTVFRPTILKREFRVYKIYKPKRKSSVLAKQKTKRIPVKKKRSVKKKKPRKN